MWTLLLLASCSPVEFPFDLERPVLTEEIPERTRLARLGDARLHPSGPSMLRPESRVSEWIPEDDLVVVDPGPRVGAVTNTGGFELLIYFDRTDLMDVIAEPIRGTARPHEIDRESGVAFPAGLFIEPVDAVPGAVRVRFDESDFVAEAWVSDTAVDQVWRASLPQADSVFEPDAFLREGAVLLDTPGGQPLAWVNDFDDEVTPNPTHYWLPVETREDPMDDHQLVFLPGERISVEGYVDTAFISEHQNSVRGMGAWGYGIGCRGHPGRTPPTIAADTAVYLEPDGPVIGRAIADLWLDLGEEVADGWTPVDVETAWGIAPLWLAP